MAVPTFDWEGKSGKTYRYWTYLIGQQFNATPGNYIFARQPQPGEWIPIYIGQASDLSERFGNHHAIPCILQNGGTHIHAHQKNLDEEARRAEESDLIAKWDPPCND